MIENSFRHRPRLAAAVSLAVAASMLAAGCGPRKVLRVYTWEDYISPGIVEAFEEQYECRVEIETFEENEELLENLVANPDAYDIITPSSYLIPALRRNKLIMRLDHSLIPNFAKNYDSAFDSYILDTSHVWSMPYAVTFTGLAYRKDLAGDAQVDSWAVIGDPALKGRVQLLDDLRETIGAALRLKGHSINTTDPAELDDAIDTVIAWKQNGVEISHDPDPESGRYAISHAYSSDVYQLMRENPDIGFSLPKEGFSVACDELVVPSATRNKELAHAFINFLYEPEVCKENMELVCAPMPCVPATEALDPEFRAMISPSAELLAKGEVIRDLEDNPRIRDLYELAWRNIIKISP